MQHYRQQRHLASLDVWVRREADRWRARIADANEDGLRLVGDLPLALDDHVLIEGPSWTADATVRWLKDGKVGVSLAQPLPAMVLSRLTGKALRLNRKSRVGLHRQSRF